MVLNKKTGTETRQLVICLQAANGNYVVDLYLRAGV
jgi:hypothetical protein